MRKLLCNGKFYLEREKFCDAVLIEDERIVKVGNREELEKEAVDEVLDMGGRTVLPGLNDSHCHISMVGSNFVQVNLSACQSIDEIVEKTKQFIADNSEFAKRGIRSIGWNQDIFTQGEARLLTRHDVDRISTEIPIILERVCGHVCAVNSKVLELAGITKETKVRGGTIERDEQGEPNGIFTENAVEWVEHFLPDYTFDEKVDFITKGLKYAESVGLTSVQSNDIGAPNVSGGFDIFRKIYEEKKASLRYRFQFCVPSKEWFDEFLATEAKEEIYQGNRITLGPVKMFKDGSLGAATAMMEHGYVSDPNNHGVCAMDYDLQKEMVQYVSDRGYQVVTHVIGDLAAEETMDAYEESFRGGKNELRHSLIHCQITNAEQLKRIRDLNLCVFYQPIFLDYDIHIVEKRVGKELAQTSYAFGTLNRYGVPIAYGTDAPVEDCNPFPCIYSAVTRCDKQGFPQGGFVPEEKVDVYTAVDAYTEGSAYVEFQEHQKGRIREGYLADFTVIDRDIFTIDPMDIRNIQCEMTIIGGEVVYCKDK